MKYKFEDKQISITAWGQVWHLKLIKNNYGNGRIAITLKDADSGEPFAVLTVNIPEVELEEHEAVFKDYSDNSLWFNAVARDTGFFQDTGKSVKLEYVEAPIFKLKEDHDE